VIERIQPVVKGTNAKGELVWGVIPMARWQMMMFPVRYTGDFMVHWMKASLAAAGIEMPNDTPSMDISACRHYGKAKPRPARQGD